MVVTCLGHAGLFILPIPRAQGDENIDDTSGCAMKGVRHGDLQRRWLSTKENEACALAATKGDEQCSRAHTKESIII